MDNAVFGRGNNLKNNFLYNAGAEVQTDIDQNLYGTFFRSYDASIGRFMQIDPMAGKHASLTPYSYAFNDSVYWNDPMGADPAFDRADEAFNNGNATYGMYGIVGDDDLNGSAFGRPGTLGFDYTYSSTFGGHWETGEITVSGNNPTSVNNNGEYSYTNTVRTWVPYTDPKSQQGAQQGDPIFGHSFVDPNSFNFQDKFGNFLTEAYYSEVFWKFAPLSGRFDIFTLEINSIAIKVNGNKMSRETAQFVMADAFHDARIAVYETLERGSIVASDAREIFLRTLNESLNRNFPGGSNIMMPDTEFTFEGDVPISVIQFIDPRILVTH